MLGSEFDYAKFLILADQDEAGQLWTNWQRLVSAGDPKLIKQCKLTSLGAQTIVSGKRRYVFECWGETARYVSCLGEYWLRRATRLDVKTSMLSWIDQDVDNLAARWKIVDKSRNVQTFQSRSRTKRDGRSAGGRGIALGSHKSDLRISVYKRPKDCYRLEVQASGRLLRRLVAEALEEWFQTRDAPTPVLWDLTRENILGTGIDRCLKSAGLPEYTLPDEIPAPDLKTLFDPHGSGNSSNN